MSYSTLFSSLPINWKNILGNELKKPYLKEILNRLEYSVGDIYPPENEILRVFKGLKIEEIKVLILGQDPYHDKNQANGLCFSVNKGIPIPPSLRNIYKELESDLGFSQNSCGDLTSWAEQGVFLLNAALTVGAHSAESHLKFGWETFTDKVIEQISLVNSNVVFILWGNYAQKKKKLINQKKHFILESAHPSPLSAYRGFFGSKPFSKCNSYLISKGKCPINWEIK